MLVLTPLGAGTSRTSSGRLTRESEMARAIHALRLMPAATASRSMPATVSSLILIEMIT